jgi:hypothetical protein
MLRLKMSVFVLLLTVIPLSSAIAGDTSNLKGVENLKISGQWFLAYQSEDIGGVTANRFKVNRSYLTVVKGLARNFSGRITLDSHLASNGDYGVRLKYAYAKFSLPTSGFLTKPFIEAGLAHRPWLDFEEHINFYRMQGTMFQERNGLFNSADLGVLFSTLLGGEMDDDYKKNVNSKYAGRYGSFAVGIFNGGGYHAVEKNEAKSIEGRLTLRPVPDVIPGLQLTYNGKFGKGNVADNAPDFQVNTGFVSFETPWVTLTGTYYSGKGNQGGSAVDADGEAISMSGYSAFGELKLKAQHLSLIGRYDHFDPDTDVDDNENNRIIAGIAYHLTGHNKILLDYDTVSYTASDTDADSRVQLTLEVHF